MGFSLGPLIAMYLVMNIEQIKQGYVNAIKILENNSGSYVESKKKQIDSRTKEAHEYVRDKNTHSKHE